VKYLSKIAFFLTTANIFGLFFFTTESDPCLSDGFKYPLLCLVTTHALYRQTDRQTDGKVISIAEC